jgi:hypothetical protein
VLRLLLCLLCLTARQAHTQPSLALALHVGLYRALRSVVSRVSPAPPRAPPVDLAAPAPSAFDSADAASAPPTPRDALTPVRPARPLSGDTVTIRLSSGASDPDSARSNSPATAAARPQTPATPVTPITPVRPTAAPPAPGPAPGALSADAGCALRQLLSYSAQRARLLLREVAARRMPAPPPDAPLHVRLLFLCSP